MSLKRRAPDLYRACRAEEIHARYARLKDAGRLRGPERAISEAGGWQCAGQAAVDYGSDDLLAARLDGWRAAGRDGEPR